MNCRSTYSGKGSFRQLAGIFVAVIAALWLAPLVRPANAQRHPQNKDTEVVQSRNPGTPIMAVVSLGNQRVTIYDDNGWIMRAPVSSGRRGYETPAGIYAVIQKEAEHYSNLYEDGYMPFMQRITWSGIALHGGPLPGYPASHGCVRMPVGFAEELFNLTKIGMRVIVARNDPVPVEFKHPFLQSLNPAHISESVKDPGAPQSTDLGVLPTVRARPTSQSLAIQKAVEAKDAAARADAARLDSIKKTLENSRISAALHLAESAKARLQIQVTAAQAALETAASPEAIQAAKELKTTMTARLAEAEARFNAAALAANNRPDVVRAREQAEAAQSESSAATEAAAEAARKAAPVSIFISRKTQRLYVRQSFRPLLDVAISFQNPDQPVGTHVFTALDYTRQRSDLRWNVVSVGSLPKTVTADSALEQIVIAPEVLDRISQLFSPGSSLIISDEAISTETANDTDFVVLMSGEPQGGIKGRRRDPEARYRYNAYDRPYGVYNRPYGIFWQ